MKRNFIICILCIAFIITSCGSVKPKDSERQSDATSSSVSSQTQEVVAKETPSPTPPSRTAKKTVKEAFGVWIDEEKMAELQRRYFSKEYDEVRYDDLSAWMDKEGNYHCPKGYEIAPGPEEVFGGQQMPQELLDKISTEELYQLIMDAPGAFHNQIYDTYLQMLSYYYMHYNFLQNLMEREDCATVVHQYYQKYTNKEIKKYSKRYSDGQKNDSEHKKESKFQLTEGLEWFFLYKEGKEVPDDYYFGFEILGW